MRLLKPQKKTAALSDCPLFERTVLNRGTGLSRVQAAKATCEKSIALGAR
jgi:hypothetical protein